MSMSGGSRASAMSRPSSANTSQSRSFLCAHSCPCLATTMCVYPGCRSGNGIRSRSFSCKRRRVGSWICKSRSRLWCRKLSRSEGATSTLSSSIRMIRRSSPSTSKKKLELMIAQRVARDARTRTLKPGSNVARDCRCCTDPRTGSPCGLLPAVGFSEAEPVPPKSLRPVTRDA